MRDLSFEVRSGEIFALLGPNGASGLLAGFTLACAAFASRAFGRYQRAM